MVKKNKSNKNNEISEEKIKQKSVLIKNIKANRELSKKVKDFSDKPKNKLSKIYKIKEKERLKNKKIEEEEEEEEEEIIEEKNI